MHLSYRIKLIYNSQLALQYKLATLAEMVAYAACRMS